MQGPTRERVGDGFDALRAEAGTAFDGPADDGYAGAAVDSYGLAAELGADATFDDDGLFLGWEVSA